MSVEWDDPTQSTADESNKHSAIELSAEELESTALLMVAAWFEQHEPYTASFLMDSTNEIANYENREWYVITCHVVVDGIPETHVFHANPKTLEIYRVSTS